MAIYSTEKCPNCKSIIRSQKNPTTTIHNPFGKCTGCGQIIVHHYKKEWVSISPFKRVMMNTFRWFNRQEFKNDISESLRRTEVIEYVEQLRNAGIKIFPVKNHQLASKHDDAVTYSLHNYTVPKPDGPNISKEDLPNVTEFTRRELHSTYRLLDSYEKQIFLTPPLTHGDRVYFSYRAFKPSLLNALFPDGILYAEFIIKRFAEILLIDLNQIECTDYFLLLIMYYELMRAMITGLSKEQIIAHMLKQFPTDLTNTSQVEGLLSMFN